MAKKEKKTGKHKKRGMTIKQKEAAGMQPPKTSKYAAKGMAVKVGAREAASEIANRTQAPPASHGVVASQPRSQQPQRPAPKPFHSSKFKPQPKR
jgi:hypothetical protein